MLRESVARKEHMKTYRLSVGEIWSRTYLIDAESPQDAYHKYERYAYDDGKELDVSVMEPEYIDDIESDIIMWDENGNTINIRDFQNEGNP